MSDTQVTPVTGQDPPEIVRHGSARGNWFQQVGWRHLVAVVALIFGLFPILFVISAAFNPLGTLSSSQLIPSGASLENFRKLFANTEYVNWYWNTLLIATLASVFSMFISACAAYAFSRYRFKGRRMGLLGLLLIQMFPQFLAIVTLYLMFSTISDYYPRIGFNTPWSLIILSLGGALAVGLWGLVAGERNNNFGVFAAGSVLAAIPIVLLFQILQRFIVGGLTTGAVKG
jgi:arabinogalactan oligomer/maltooligosaccharide transport system permease protein